MTAFSKLQRASFGGVEFPVESVDVSCAARVKQHVFPYSNGAANEILGRGLYTISMNGNFQNTFIKYPSLYPQGLAKIRTLFETGAPADLVIPTIGTIKAILISYKQSASSKIVSGETATFEFLEDLSSDFLASKLINVAARDLTTAAKSLKDLANPLANKDNLFDSIQKLSNFIGSIKDQRDLYSALIQAKLELLVGLCSQCNSSAKELQNPLNSALLDALNALWAAATELKNTTLGGGLRLVAYTVPKTMSVSQIAGILYGDSSRGGDVLQANIIEDPFSVPGGTVIKYITTG